MFKRLSILDGKAPPLLPMRQRTVRGQLEEVSPQIAQQLAEVLLRELHKRCLSSGDKHLFRVSGEPTAQQKLATLKQWKGDGSSSESKTIDLRQP